jgi:four helix bundle protein
MSVFEVSKHFPKEEKFSLTDQVRRSSRSVCANLREAWAKRRYEAHFISKVTDADGENGETDTWLDFALTCGWLSGDKHKELAELCQDVGALLGRMISNPTTFIQKSTPRPPTPPDP